MAQQMDSIDDLLQGHDKLLTPKKSITIEDPSISRVSSIRASPSFVQENDSSPTIKKSPSRGSTFSIGISKDYIIKIFSACKANLMGKSTLAFFQKHDKRGDGVFSSTAFIKLIRNVLKVSSHDVPDEDLEILINLFKLEDPDGQLKVVILASYFEKGATVFIRQATRLLLNDASKTVEEYNPFLEFEYLRNETNNQLLEMEQKYNIKYEKKTLDDMDNEIEKWRKEKEDGTHLHPREVNQIGSIDGKLETISLTDMGNYYMRYRVQRMADVPPAAVRETVEIEYE